MTATLPGQSPQESKLIEAFFPYASKRTFDAINKNIRFVHYTSADVATKIIKFSEIEHGFGCLDSAFKTHIVRFTSFFDGMFPGFTAKREALYNSWLPHMRTDTYIACMSEHDDSEDRIGRLSMWRAYAKSAGIALVMNNPAFFAPSHALRAYTNPVLYADKKMFADEFEKVLDALEASKDLVQGAGEKAAQNLIFTAFRFATLCTKHPGFHEEREWRIVHSPAFEKSDRLLRDTQTIEGIPQTIMKIPLKNIPEDGLVGVDVAELVDRVIVGPTQYPGVIYEVFVSLLAESGLKNAESRVFISDIPLRT